MKDKTLTSTEWAEVIDGPPPPPKRRPPLPFANVTPEQQMEIERFIYQQAEMLDDKRWEEWIGLFTPDGKYWMPVTDQQTVADDMPNIFYEDIDLMTVRMKRVNHPRAWSQKPPHRTAHVVSGVIVESFDPKTGDAVVRSKFYMTEFRRDVLRYFTGKYRHTLKKTPDGYRIKLQRVDLVNGDGIYEYVLQTWI
ncbi:MAG: aromatic-ring-hydroxylating dioxygenase subunit beta [Alphaproteobacteria bacterium]